MAIINTCAITVGNLQGIGPQCADNIGGIKRVFLCLNGDVDTVTAANGEVTAITMVEDEGTARKFKEYSFRKATGGMTSTATVNDAVGTIFYTTELQLQFSAMTKEKNVEINNITRQGLKAIVEDRKGNYWYLGKDDAVTATAAVAQAGTAYEDLNGYTLTLSDVSLSMPLAVDPALITDTLIDFNE
jgi:hypothetical protein